MSLKKMLQIVTERSKKLKTLRKLVGCLAFLLLVSSCSSTQQSVASLEPTKEETKAIRIEPHKGRISPTVAVARSLKYNNDAIKKLMTDKVLGVDAQQNVKQHLQQMKDNSSGSVAVAIKELDFAILFAAVNYYPTDKEKGLLLNKTVSDLLIQGTLKAHKTALYNAKKIFEVKRKLRQHQKQLTIFIRKQSQNSLTEADLQYKKILEDNIDDLKKMQQKMEQEINDYVQLVRVDNKKLDLDGKNFFEQLKLPENADEKAYQLVALENRYELDGFARLSFSDVTGLVTAEYPENEERIKGFYLQDAVYTKGLVERGDAQAQKLVDVTLEYLKAKPRRKADIAIKLGKELYKAIYIRQELAFNLAQKAQKDYVAQLHNLKQIQYTLQKLGKISRPNAQQQAEILKMRHELLQNQNLADEIIAEKIATYVSLNLYTNSNNITSDVWDKNISELADFVKELLMAEVVKYDDKEDAISLDDKGWAQKENWLEEVMEAPKKQVIKEKKIMSKPLLRNNNKLKLMQLGAFLEKSTAEKEWKQLIVDVPELQNYVPVYDNIRLADIPMVRIIVRSDSEDLYQICQKVQNKGHECFLRD